MHSPSPKATLSEHSQQGISTDVSARYAVALPVFLAVAPFLTLPLGEKFSFYNQWMVSEKGAIEHLTVVLAAVGFVLALLAFRRRRACPKPWFGSYMAIFAAGFTYIAGEELSWGQHLMGWQSPEFFEKSNLQNETNLHNLHRSLDRVPKSIIGAGVVISGVLYPLFARWRRLAPASPAGSWYWLWPTSVVQTTAGLFLAIWLLDRGLLRFGLRSEDGWYLNLTEHRELMLVYFLVLYCGSLCVRLRSRQEQTA